MNFKTKKQRNRYNNLVPNGIPRYIRCYDNGGASADRYTVVFTGHYTGTDRNYWYISMSSNPFHCLGVGIIDEAPRLIDKPSYKHLGKKIKHDSLPAECKTFVMSTYLYLWNFTDNEGYTLK